MSKNRMLLFGLLCLISTSVFAATFTVSRTDDRNTTCFAADCSLREAMALANATPGTDVIRFELPMPSTIELGAPLTITGNVIVNGPGTIHYSLRDMLTIDANSHGAVFNIPGNSATIAGLVLTGGTAAAIQHTNSAGTTLTVDTVHLTANRGNNGGAIASIFGTLVVRDSTFTGNTASSSGGAIYHEGTQLTVTGSTFSGNVSQEDSDFGGGAIYAEDATTIINSTFHANTSSYGGGAVNVTTFGAMQVVIRNSTFTANTAAYGGALFFGEGNVTLVNSIVALNTATDLPSSNQWYQDASSFTNTNNYIGATPTLGPLQDNGGPTFTRALLTGSPAINAGSNALALNESGAALATDQRGDFSTRIVGGTVDIGAYEAGGFPEVSFTVTRTDDRNVSCTPGDCSLREAVAAANAAAGTEIVDFAPSLFNQTITTTSVITVTTDMLILGFGPELLTVDRDGAGAIFSVTGTNVTIAGLELTGGTASAIQHTGAGRTLTLDTMRITGNTGNNGGGVSSTFGTLIVRDSTFSNNIAASDGGGIFHEGTQLTVTGSTFSGNVSNDDSDFGGGGIYAEDATTIINSTFSGNSSQYGGGGLRVSTISSIPVVVRNSTFIGNTAVYGGGMFFEEGNVTVVNSLVALNTASGMPSSNHWYQDASSFNATFNYTGATPNVGPLQDNGGPTHTRALLCGSPALNAGSNAQVVGSFDQRGSGYSRIVGTVDIGAFEAQVPPSCLPLLTATKSVSGTFTTGGTIQYTIVLTNIGGAGQPDNASHEFTDTVPAGVTVTGVTATAGTAANVGNLVTWNGALAPAATVTIVITGTVTAPATTVVSNQGSALYDGDSNGSNEASSLTDSPAVQGLSDPTTFTVAGGVFITATKTVSGTFQPGGAVQYTITLTNSGSVAQADNAGAEFTDTVPVGVTVTGVTSTSGTAANVGNDVSWNGSIAPAAAVTITVNGTVAAASGVTVSNQGTASYDADGNGINDATSLTDDPALPGLADPTAFTVVSPTAITATKTVAGTFVPGAAIQYVVTLTNSGGVAQPDNASNEFADSVPAGATVASVSASADTAASAGNDVTWNGSIAPASSVTITINATIAAAPGATVSNQGTAFFDADGNGSNESSVLTDDPALPGAADATSFTVLAPTMLSATKTVSGTFINGGAVQYSITLTNNGAVAQADNAGDEFTDVVPAGVTVTSVSASSGTAANAGNSVSWSGPLAPGASVTITINGTVAAAAGDVVSNQGTAFYDADADGTNESSVLTDDPALAGAADATMFTVLGPVSIGALKTVTGTFVTGGTIQYVVTLTNSGGLAQPDNAGDEFTDVVPAGVTVTSVSATSGSVANAGNNVTWNGSLAAGASVTITISGTVTAATGATVSNQGAVAFDADANGSNEASGLTDDPAVGGLTDRTNFTVVATPFLSATKTASGTFLPNSIVQYTITIMNSGGNQPDNAGDEFTDVVPAGVAVTSVSATSGSAVRAGNTVTWNGALASGASALITISGTVTASSGATVSNQALVAFDADANGTNETTVQSDDPALPGSADATAFAVAFTPVQLSVTKIAGGSFAYRGTVRYTIVITNQGGALQPDNPSHEFVDVLPAGLTLSAVSATSGTASASGNTVTWNGSLAGGASVTITIDAAIDAAPGSTISNQGTAYYDPASSGLNDAMTLTDDPAAPGTADPTAFTVAAAAAADVPALDPALLVMLMALLAFTAIRAMR